MTPEERQQKEGALEELRIKADAAHQAAATGEEALVTAAEAAEDAYSELKAELDATPDGGQASPPASTEDEEEEGKQDIDFEKELTDLEGGRAPEGVPPQRTELEKAERGVFFAAKRLKELGGDPSKVIKPADETPTPTPTPRTDRQEDLDPRYVSKDDIAEQEAQTLSRTDAERKVIMWHYKHSIQKTGSVKADIENAFYIANKGRIRRSIDEMRRTQDVRPNPGSGPGRRPSVVPRVPQLSSGDQSTLRRRGFKPNADGSWEAKRYVMRFSPGKGWVTEAKSVK